MDIAIGSVFLLLASVLFGALFLIAMFGLIMFTIRRQRHGHDASRESSWDRGPAFIPGPDERHGVVATGK